MEISNTLRSTLVFSLYWRLSSIVATSTCEAELMAYCSCACEVIYARKLAAEIGFCQMSPTPIYEDNEGAMVLVKNMHLRNRSKHIALRFTFAKALYDNGQINPVAVSSEKQHADIGTKAVGQSDARHSRMGVRIGVHIFIPSARC